MLAISIVALLAGLIGILAVAKSYIVLILIVRVFNIYITKPKIVFNDQICYQFAVIMVVLMGLNIAEAVRIKDSWETTLSKLFSVKSNNETLYAIAVAMAVIQGLAFLTSLLLSYLVYVIRNPTGALKRAMGQ